MKFSKSSNRLCDIWATTNSKNPIVGTAGQLAPLSEVLTAADMFFSGRRLIPILINKILIFFVLQTKKPATQAPHQTLRAKFLYSRVLMEIVVSVYCVIVFVNHPDGGKTAFIQTLLYLIYATLALSFMRVSARCLFTNDKSLKEKII